MVEFDPDYVAEFHVHVLPEGRLDTGAPPESVQIDCKGLDPTKTIQLVINGSVRAEFPVPVTGLFSGSFPIRTGVLRKALQDIEYVNQKLRSGFSDILARIKIANGNELTLRYKP